MTDEPRKSTGLGSRYRRLFLRRVALPAAVVALLLPAAASRVAGSAVERALSFHHTHTDEDLSVVYWKDGGYVAESLKRVAHFLRDFRNDELHEIDPALLDVLHTVREAAGSDGVYHVISGYRSPETNAMLRGKSGGVARNSLHMQGRAIDVRLPGVETSRLHDVSLSLELGGVGYYRESDFVHLDTGRVRTW
jgi:uncharacterized protein YcbK (DUF882 family)